MEVDTALLCEAASIRAGLLYILGGGITHVVREEFPSPLGMVMALRVLAAPEEATSPHVLEIVLWDVREDVEINRTKINVEITEEIPEDTRPEILMAWDFPGKPELPHGGSYRFDILIDGATMRTVRFSAAPRSETPDADEDEQTEGQ